GGAPLLASSLARRIPRFFVRGDRTARHPLPGPPAPRETTTVTVAESCTTNAPVAFPSSFTHTSERPLDRPSSPGGQEHSSPPALRPPIATPHRPKSLDLWRGCSTASSK